MLSDNFTRPVGRYTILLLSGAALSAVATPAMAAGTRAGSVIENTATATYDVGPGTSSVNSNQHDLQVDELIDVTVDWADPADVPTTPGATGQVLTFTVTNNGNGNETYGLTTVSTIGGDNYDPTVNQIVIDDGDGIYEPGIDAVYVPGTNDPALEPDASVTVFVISTTPGGVADTNRGGVQLVAASQTGTGAPGTNVGGANAGEGGSDAVVGTSGGDGLDNGFYVVAAATVSLVKSATVADPFGGSDALPGSTVTYTITANTVGGGTLPNLRITDAVPTGTTYVPGSITLGGSPLSDATDADAGNFGAGTVTVNLGNVPGGQTRVVTFQVTIN